MIFIALALVPKLAAVMLAIPGPVVAAYFIVLLAMLFVLGLRMVVKDGLDYRKSMIVGVSFWVGVGFQQQVIFVEHLGEWWWQPAWQRHDQRRLDCDAANGAAAVALCAPSNR